MASRSTVVSGLDLNRIGELESLLSRLFNQLNDASAVISRLSQTIFASALATPRAHSRSDAEAVSVSPSPIKEAVAIALQRPIVFIVLVFFLQKRSLRVLDELSDSVRSAAYELGWVWKWRCFVRFIVVLWLDRLVLLCPLPCLVLHQRVSPLCVVVRPIQVVCVAEADSAMVTQLKRAVESKSVQIVLISC